jgi:hypothetical protein
MFGLYRIGILQESGRMLGQGDGARRTPADPQETTILQKKNRRVLTRAGSGTQDSGDQRCF